MASRYSNGGRGGSNNIRNACLTMHQPWASLLIYGIKRIEGRSWPAPIRGRLWIHAASKIPDPETIKAMEEFYREIYAVDGVTDLKFPEHYPVSRLLGCVEVVGCVKCEELTSWKEVPEGVRLEGQTEYCWLCEKPQKLIIPFEMRGFQGVYNLENRIYEAAIRGLRPIDPPLPVKFPLPDSQDSFSLKPGSMSSRTADFSPTTPNTPELNNAIAGARAAATQFKKNSVQVGTRNNKAIAPAQGVYNSENRIYEAAIRGLRPVDPPLLVSSRTADSSPTTPNTPELNNATTQFKKISIQTGTRNNKAMAPAQGQNRQIPGWFDDGSSSSRLHRK